MKLATQNARAILDSVRRAPPSRIPSEVRHIPLRCAVSRSRRVGWPPYRQRCGIVLRLTTSGLVMGSPSYMSPEHVRDARDVDRRADVWALGVIAFELVTGVRPFDGRTLGETFSRILAEPVPLIRNLRPDTPEGFAAVVSQCLERRVEARIQDVGELASKLAPYGSKDAAGSVERILRLSGASPGTSAWNPNGVRPRVDMAACGFRHAVWRAERGWFPNARDGESLAHAWAAVTLAHCSRTESSSAGDSTATASLARGRRSKTI